MHPDTFYRRITEKYGVGFTEYQQQKCSKGDSMLRETQFDVALEKDKTMLIWLGKQRLGQKEPEASIKVTSKSSAEKFIELMEAQAREEEVEE